MNFVINLFALVGLVVTSIWVYKHLPCSDCLRLRLSTKCILRLKQTSCDLRCSLTDVVRWALANYDHMHVAVNRGAKIIIRDDDGTERELMMTP